MTETLNLDELIASGIHFGHRVRSWNPKMKGRILKRSNGIHIIDVKETVKGLIRAGRFVEMVVAEGKEVLFVGTKRQAAASVMDAARSVDMPFVCERWLGGILTNHTTVRQRLDRLQELETLTMAGEESGFSKKALASMMREHRKIHRNLNGIRHMEGMPGCVVIVDVHREDNAVAEARRMKIPTVALVDTDSDPELVDIAVPGNDDALKAINIFLDVVVEGVRRGKARRAVEAQTSPKEESRQQAAAEAPTTTETNDIHQKV